MCGRLDRITSLPEGVICHILSFLPPRDAVSTSILSKKFYPLWRSLSLINLTDEDVVTGKVRYRMFTNFVFSLLLLRDATQPIKKFTLNCVSQKTCEFNVDTWVSFVLRQKVEHLELIMYFPELSRYPHFGGLPMGILRCRTLVVLILRGFQPDVIDVSRVELPSLTLLHLDMIEFTVEECIPMLLSGCPRLEDFKATNVQLYDEDERSSENFKSLTKLISAEIHIHGRIVFPLEVLYNVQHLTLHIDRVSPDYNNIPAFYNLTKMKLTFDKVYKWQWLIGVLGHCPKLQILDLDLDIESYGSWVEHVNDDWVYPEFVPECVSLHLSKCTVHHYEGTKGDLRFAIYILQNASVLQVMRICNERSVLAKFKMEKETSSCEKRSTTCQLSFY